MRCFEEFGKINVLKYTLWLFSQQLLAVRFVLEQWMCRAAFASRWIQRQPDVVTYIIVRAAVGARVPPVIFHYAPLPGYPNKNKSLQMC